MTKRFPYYVELSSHRIRDAAALAIPEYVKWVDEIKAEAKEYYLKAAQEKYEKQWFKTSVEDLLKEIENSKFQDWGFWIRLEYAFKVEARENILADLESLHKDFACNPNDESVLLSDEQYRLIKEFL